MGEGEGEGVRAVVVVAVVVVEAAELLSSLPYPNVVCAGSLFFSLELDRVRRASGDLDSRSGNDARQRIGKSGGGLDIAQTAEAVTVGMYTQHNWSLVADGRAGAQAAEAGD